MAADRLDVPRLTSRSGKLWAGATLVAVLAVCGYLFATQPQNRWAVFVLVPLAVLFVLWLVVRRTWVETTTGTVVERTIFSRREARFADAGKLDLITNRGGGLLLRVGRQGRGAVLVPVLALTDYVEASQPPSVLRTLADQVEKWAPRQERVVSQLRRQAEHVEQGGSAKESPLAPLVSTSMTTAAKGGGAAGSGGSLLG